MPYTSHTWANGDSATAARLNNIESQYLESSLSFDPDLFTAGFVLTGYAATGTVGTTTVNVAAGTAYLLQADGTTRQRKLTSSTQTTSTPSTTYHLYLQPDGTWYWSTSNAPAANSLHIADVATNGSGQISTITDQRSFSASMMPNMVGPLTLPLLGFTTTGRLYFDGGFAGNNAFMFWDAGDPRSLHLLTVQTGSANFFHFTGWDGSGARSILSIGGQVGAAKTYINNDGSFGGVAGQVTAGSFGVPVDIGQTIRTHVTSTGSVDTTILSAPADGLYRMSGYVLWQNGTNSAVVAAVGFTDPDLGTLAHIPFGTSTTGTTACIPLNGNTTFTAGSDRFVLYPQVFYAKSGTNITFQFNDPSGTPNDFWTIYIERLA